MLDPNRTCVTCKDPLVGLQRLYCGRKCRYFAKAPPLKRSLKKCLQCEGEIEALSYQRFCCVSCRRKHGNDRRGVRRRYKNSPCLCSKCGIAFLSWSKSKHCPSCVAAPKQCLFCLKTFASKKVNAVCCGSSKCAASRKRTQRKNRSWGSRVRMDW